MNNKVYCFRFAVDLAVQNAKVIQKAEQLAIHDEKSLYDLHPLIRLLGHLA